MIEKTEQEIMHNWKDDNTKPMVSVCTITYNHEKYISEAIDSFLMQETNFSFEVVIGEDCSTDNTRKIIEEYKGKYPNIIKLITSENNVGMQKNAKRTMEACQGEYIALCEGDDYWTDAKKLQIQKDFLEKNEDYAICFHQTMNYNETQNKILRYFSKEAEDRDYTIFDLLKNNITNTCAVMYKRIGIEIPEFFNQLKLGDWPTHMLYAEKGKIRYFSKCMGTYRLHDGGIWSAGDRIKNIDYSIDMLKMMNEYFDNRYEKFILTTIATLTVKKAVTIYKNQRRINSIRLLLNALKQQRLSSKLYLSVYYLMKVIVK